MHVDDDTASSPAKKQKGVKGQGVSPSGAGSFSTPLGDLQRGSASSATAAERSVAQTLPHAEVGDVLAAVAAPPAQVHAAGTDLECLPQQFQALALLISNSIGAQLSSALDARLQPMQQQLQGLQQLQDEALTKSDIARMKQEIISELRPGSIPSPIWHAPEPRPDSSSSSSWQGAVPASTLGPGQASGWQQYQQQRGADPWHEGQDPWHDWKSGGNNNAQKHVAQQQQQQAQQHQRDQKPDSSFVPQQIYIRGWAPFGDNVELPRGEVELFR
jgi:hypothetical protein